MARPVTTDWEGAKQAWSLAYERGEYVLSEHDGVPLTKQELSVAYTYFYNVRRYLRRQPLANNELLYKISRCKLDVFDGTQVKITRRDASESVKQETRGLVQKLISENVMEERKKLHL